MDIITYTRTFVFKKLPISGQKNGNNTHKKNTNL